VRVGGIVVAVLGASLLVSLPACDPCWMKGTDPTYSSTTGLSGDVSGAPDLALPRTLATAQGIACSSTEQLCLMTPSNCHGQAGGCLAFDLATPAPSAGSLHVEIQNFSFDVPAVPLSSAGLTTSVSLSGFFRNGNIPVSGTLASGSIASVLTQDELDVAFILDVVTGDGEHIKIPDGLAVVSGHAGTQCHAD
jgi:hypothetical protein